MSHRVTAFFNLLAKWVCEIMPPNGTGSGHTDPAIGVYQIDTGKQFTITAYPDAGSFLDYWTVDGVKVGSNNPITIMK